MGRATALSAASSGWRVALSGRRHKRVEAVAREVEALGGDVLALPGDVRSIEDVAECVSAIEQRWGRLDGLVLAAGMNAPRRTWEDQDLEEFGDIVETNLVSVARVVQLALPQLRRSRGNDRRHLLVRGLAILSRRGRGLQRQQDGSGVPVSVPERTGSCVRSADLPSLSWRRRHGILGATPRGTRPGCAQRHVDRGRRRPCHPVRPRLPASCARRRTCHQPRVPALSTDPRAYSPRRPLVDPDRAVMVLPANRVISPVRDFLGRGVGSGWACSWER